MNLTITGVEHTVIASPQRLPAGTAKTDSRFWNIGYKHPGDITHTLTVLTLTAAAGVYQMVAVFMMNNGGETGIGAVAAGPAEVD